MRVLISAPGTSSTDAHALALRNDCAGYYLECPLVYQHQAATDGWTFPCVVATSEEETDVTWTAAAIP